MLVGPGEGAGVIDIGDGLAVAVRIESHNHPSAVEPYQGAATGVGGIIRDIFSMGARPIALMDPLRFGSLDDPRTRYLFEGVVSGISGYGNAVGVPTVGGEVVFDDCYRDNPLVNVLCLGVLPNERLVLARAEGAGNLAVLLGSSTGRDGIGGASVLASAGFEEGSEAKRPSVQVGDPFEEKRLIEACLELLDAGLAVGVQDLGAAGLSCAASETAAKGGAGMDVDVARGAPARAGHEPGRGDDVARARSACSRSSSPSDLDEVLALVRAVGDPRHGRRARSPTPAASASSTACSTRRRARREPAPRRRRRPMSSDRADRRRPVGSLGDGPVYDRPLARPADQDALQAADPAAALPRVPRRHRPVRRAARAARDADHRRQVVGVAPVRPPAVPQHRRRARRRRRRAAAEGHPTARSRSPPTARPASAALDPRTGGRLVVLEAARNVACAGARPARARELPQLRQSRAPRGDVAVLRGGRRHERGVRGARHPGHRRQRQLLQRVARRRHRPDAGRRRARPDRRARRASRRRPRSATASAIVVLGATRAELGGSEWAAVVHGLDGGVPPAADLDAARALHDLVRELVGERVVDGVHDCSDGGLAVALAEMAIAGGCGFRVEPAPGDARAAALVLLRVGVAGRAVGRPGAGRRRARPGRARPASWPRSSDRRSRTASWWRARSGPSSTSRSPTRPGPGASDPLGARGHGPAVRLPGETSRRPDADLVAGSRST